MLPHCPLKTVVSRIGKKCREYGHVRNLSTKGRFRERTEDD